MLKKLQRNVREKNLVTHLVGFLDLESISIDDGVGDCEKQRGQDSFHLKDPAILRMRLVLDGLSLDMMRVGRESCSEAVCSHSRLICQLLVCNMLCLDL